MDGKNKRGRPHREWTDDIEEWCGANLQELSHSALNVGVGRQQALHGPITCNNGDNLILLKLMTYDIIVIV